MNGIEDGTEQMANLMDLVASQGENIKRLEAENKALLAMCAELAIDSARNAYEVGYKDGYRVAMEYAAKELEGIGP